MKKIALIVILLVSTGSTYGQQFLWSTLETPDEKEVKFVAYRDAPNEVLEFYDHYDFYYDGVGYSKNNFFKNLEKYGDDSDGWNEFTKRIKGIKDLTVFAFRANLGQGSIVLVLIISDTEANMVSFSNAIESSPNRSTSSKRDKFTEWFNTLLK